MKRTSHRMSLRSRGENVPKAAPQRSRRAVLGDVSNKLSTRQSSKTDGIAKRTRNNSIKSVPNVEKDDTSKPLSALEEEKKNCNDNRKRRFSLRLSAKRKRDDTEKPEAEDKPKTVKKTKQGTSQRRARNGSIDVSVLEAPVKKGPVYLVHPDYRLKSFIGTLTDGTAPHDQRDEDDELKVTPYVTDLFQNLYEAEKIYRPCMYMSEQRDINAKMRAILVDWLVEVHMKFRLVPETLYLCVNIIDRYCNEGLIKRSQLQLVGVTALLIACKYEEIYPPEVSDCVYITDKAYTRKEVLDMEQKIVHKLNFHFTVPTAYPFLQRFLNLINASQLIKNAASYYLERTLQEYDINIFKPSVVSAAAVILAVNNPDTCRRDEFEIELVSGMPEILLEYTGFKESEIRQCAKQIAQKVAEEPITASKRQLIAVKRKYENRKYMHVSAMRLPSADITGND